MDLQQLVGSLIPVIKDVIAGSLTMSDSGVIGGAKEAGAIATYLKEAANSFQGNTIIEGVVSQMFGDDGIQLPDLETLDVTNLFSSVGNITALLNSVEGGEQVKQFIFGLAENVAGAAGGGLFGGGQRVNAGEQQFLEGLKATLGV
ncbi:MAG: hypothetical protein SGJ24_03855 [Chloroflexota bacterium]|nr:hypothetical protein [Chloroflexota bacterium]